MAEKLKPCPFCGGEAELYVDIIKWAFMLGSYITAGIFFGIKAIIVLFLANMAILIDVGQAMYEDTKDRRIAKSMLDETFKGGGEQ